MTDEDAQIMTGQRQRRANVDRVSTIAEVGAVFLDDPNRSGRSRQGEPVRTAIPSTTIR